MVKDLVEFWPRPYMERGPWWYTAWDMVVSIEVVYKRG